MDGYLRTFDIRMGEIYKDNAQGKKEFVGVYMYVDKYME